MFSLAILALYAASCVQAIPPVPPGFTASYSLKPRTETTTRGCQQLKNEFPNLVFYPNATTYVTESTGKHRLLGIALELSVLIYYRRLLLFISYPLTLVCLHP